MNKHANEADDIRVVLLLENTRGYLRVPTFLSILVMGTNSTFKFASIWGSSTRALASNEYPGNRFCTSRNPGEDADVLFPKPRPL